MERQLLYFANPTGKALEEMIIGRIGFIDTPLQGNKRPSQVPFWCADNGCFNDKTFDEERWWLWLQKNSCDSKTCLFATAPDVLGDHTATVKRSAPWLEKIRAIGYKAAFVVQDGATVQTVPWNMFDVLFVGGSTEFKLSQSVRELVGHAKSLGMWVHMGRVNSLRRMRYADAIGCDSVDGTHLVFEPDKALNRVLRWTDDINRSQELFSLICD